MRGHYLTHREMVYVLMDLTLTKNIAFIKDMLDNALIDDICTALS